MPSGVSLNPEKEQMDTPLLIRPGPPWLLSVGGGPVISPAYADDQMAKAALPRTSAQMVERLGITDPLSLLEELATHAPPPFTTKLTFFALRD